MVQTSVAVFAAAALIVIAQANVRKSEPAFEASAIGALRAISSAQRTFLSVNGGYATSLKTLATGCRPQQSGFVSPDLSQDPTIRGGYEIRIHAQPGARLGPRDCNGAPTSIAYYATATPVRRNANATRAFAVDPGDVIWFDARGVLLVPPFHETATIKPRH